MEIEGSEGGGLFGNGGYVDGAADKEIAVESQTQESKRQIVIRISDLASFRRLVVSKLKAKQGEIADAIIKGALQGQVTLVKILLEILEGCEAIEKAEVEDIARSLANEWGVEPDWLDGCCAHCGRADGLRLESAA